MKALQKTILALLFAVFLIQVLVLVMKQSAGKLTDFSILGIAGGAGALYYFIFERKKSD